MEKLGNYLMQKGLKKRLGEENKRVIDKIKTETAVMKREWSDVQPGFSGDIFMEKTLCIE